MAATPLISIGMSVRNNAATLPLALSSLLAQTCSDWELIVFDDGSSDGSVDAVRAFGDSRILLISESTSRGLAYRLNQAIDLARGRYFARMDGDDVSLPERFSRQAAYLDSHPEVDLLGTGGVVFMGDGEALGLRPAPTRHEEICSRPWSGFYLAHPSWMGRIEWFRRHRYDVRSFKAQDYDLLLRTYAHSRFAALPDALIGYREERLDRRKNLDSRRQTLVAQWRFARRQRAWAKLPGAVAGQLAKATVELAVIGTRFERQLLGHRALPIDAVTLAHWRAFWKQLGQEAGKPCAD